MEFGIYTFGDLVAHPDTGEVASGEERTQQMLDMAKLADDVGLDVIGVGEHHGLDFVNSATATMIAAMAAVTTRIRLTSASTLISTADPVRTFQEFATADLVSKGRVEIIFGRGAFTDNFPLFGYDLDDYDALFSENVGLFAKLNTNERVTWSGSFRRPLHNAQIAPRPSQKQLPVWIGAGSPQSVMRAARLGYPLALPVLGGSFESYGRTAALYRQTWEQSGRQAQDARIAIFAHLHVTNTQAETQRDFYPYYSAYLKPLFKGAMPRAVYEQMLSSEGTFFAGSPDQVVDKIGRIVEATGAERFVGQIDFGGQRYADIANGVELFAEKVVGRIRS